MNLKLRLDTCEQTTVMQHALHMIPCVFTQLQRTQTTSYAGLDLVHGSEDIAFPSSLYRLHGLQLDYFLDGIQSKGILQ